MSENGKKIILDLCGGTGSWSKPYKEAGYDVRLITYPSNDVRTYEPPSGVYGILAAPPCNEFSIAKNGKERDFEEGFGIVRACLEIIWSCGPERLSFWALENPRGMLARWLGYPPFKFEQWEFGSGIFKPTYIWGHFKRPQRKGIFRPIDIPAFDTIGRNDEATREASRAKTPEGFAREFFNANK